MLNVRASNRSFIIVIPWEPLSVSIPYRRGSKALKAFARVSENLAGSGKLFLLKGHLPSRENAFPTG
jgi:hypothetical protein